MKTTAYLEVRSIPAGSGRFTRPDRRISVQIVPDGVEPLKVLRHDSAKKRGIHLWHIGDGYSQHTGPSSRFGIAKARANIIVDAINERMRYPGSPVKVAVDGDEYVCDHDDVIRGSGRHDGRSFYDVVYWEADINVTV